MLHSSDEVLNFEKQVPYNTQNDGRQAAIKPDSRRSQNPKTLW
jgi:hypothetical protein